MPTSAVGERRAGGEIASGTCGLGMEALFRCSNIEAGAPGQVMVLARRHILTCQCQTLQVIMHMGTTRAHNLSKQTPQKLLGTETYRSRDICVSLQNVTEALSAAVERNQHARRDRLYCLEPKKTLLYLCFCESAGLRALLVSWRQ